MPGAVGTLGPDLSDIGEDAEAVIASGGYTGTAKTAADFLREAILKPDLYIAADCGGKACQKGLMPASLGDTLSDEELEAVRGLPAGPARQRGRGGTRSVNPPR